MVEHKFFFLFLLNPYIYIGILTVFVLTILAVVLGALLGEDQFHGESDGSFNGN